MGLMRFENGKFANELGFWSRYYLAQAYQLKVQAEENVTRTQHSGAGKVKTLYKITAGKYEDLSEFAKNLGGKQ